MDQIKGITKNSEQISMLVHICQQEFQLTPNFTYDRIDEGRDQHLCKIDFQGILISTGKGHSKTESKK